LTGFFENIGKTGVFSFSEDVVFGNGFSEKTGASIFWGKKESFGFHNM